MCSTPVDDDSRRRTAKEACALVPRQPGVYRFRDDRGRLLYIGRASDLRSRTRSYWGDLAGRRHLRRMVAQIMSVEAVVCASVHEASWLERNLLVRSKPRWNRTRGGQEVPRWLVLETRSDRPGLLLTHEADPCRPSFGPYLGGDRSRVAQRGILRAWPIHLTGSRRSGSELAMAAARGVETADRDQMLVDIGRLLDRDPLAVDEITARLLAARDAAVTGLRFETAQQIQDELTAVAWLVSPQRVTASLPAELAVHGWSDGVLVSFSGTRTHLDRWDVRRVGERDGQALARLTPLEWRGFATVNARLAADLAQAQGHVCGR
ncbi:MAG TPA: GIY-YIG nuclease family protein [Microlunatus sp.]|nr:GIY-YIG nuclease family protein [Microlunatus sp.]